MIKNARKYRAVDAAENENDYVYIRKDICEEINNVMTQKSKLTSIKIKYSN